MQQADSALAGLGFQFKPMDLQPAAPSKGSSGGRPKEQQAVGSAAPTGASATAPAAASRSVAFNLKARKPGPAYSSPEALASLEHQVKGNQCSGHNTAADGSGLARLKASLARRRAAAQAEGQPAAAAAALVASPAAPASAALHTAANDEAAVAERPAPEQQAALLLHAERLLAGCGAAVIDNPLPDMQMPEHMALGMPVLAIPPLPAAAQQAAGSGAASVAAAAAAMDSSRQGAAAIAESAGGTQVADEAFHISAYRPATSAMKPQPAGAIPDEAAAGPCPTPQLRDGSRAEEAEAGLPEPGSTQLQQQPLPTLEAALQRLGLLPQQTGTEDDTQAACRSSSLAAQPDSPTSSHALCAQLQAVRVVLAAKQQAGLQGEVLPLVRRLRQVRLNLEYHKANMQRWRSSSSGPGTGLNSAPPPGPWLSGRSSALDSKHRSSRSGSPGRQVPARTKVAPTQQASELQVQLLGSLHDKLLQKLGLAVLRQAAAAARLRRQLLHRVMANTEAEICRSVLVNWHEAAVPTPEQEEAARSLAQQLAQRRQRCQLGAWHQLAARAAWQRRQLVQGQQVLRRRLLAAALQHWRCYCQQQLVSRLQAALAARWVAAWGQRRVFHAWRTAARRSSVLREALMSLPGDSSAAKAAAPQQLPSQLEALSATAKAFQPMKDFVAEAVQQLVPLRRGLRFGAPGSSSMLAAAAQEAAVSQQQPPELPLGSVEALLALLPGKQQTATADPVDLVVALDRQPQLLLPAAMPDMLDVQTGAAPVAGAALDDAELAAPAPDPGSPPGLYNPASYASPAKHRGQQQRLARPAPRHAAAAAAPQREVAVEHPAAVEAELLECQEQVQRLHRELAALEQESNELQQQCDELEQAAAAAEQQVHQHRHACTSAAAAKQAASEAMQAAVQQHTAAAAEYAAHERQLQQRQQACQQAAAAEAGARAAAHAAAEAHALAAAGVERWGRAVEGIAKELAACHRTQQGPVMVKLKEARQRLEQHKREAAAAQQQLPGLEAAAKQAAQQTQQAQQLVMEAQQCLVLAAEQRARCQKRLDASMAQHEAAAVAAVAAEQEAAAAEQRPRLLASQQQLVAGRLRQAAQQVMHKQQQAVLLQKQVQQLQQRHQDAIAAMLADSQQQRRDALKRRLALAQAAAGGLPCEAGLVGPDIGPGGVVTGPGPSPAAAAAPAGALVAHTQAPCWSCSSSEMGSPQSEAPLAAPLTVDEAAERFYCHGLLRRALHILRLEAHHTRVAMLAAAHHWRQRQQAAVLLAWQAHAAEAADWLAAAGLAIRRRWLLRQWQAVAAARRWERQADAAADAFARRRLLAAGLASWQLHVEHEQWRDAAHQAVVELRMRNVLQGWRNWARQRRQKAAKLRAALAVYERRLLAAAMRQWLWVQHSKALLHRVFSTAAGLWQEEVGVRLYERNYELVRACWGAWQLYVLRAQEERRQAILWNAAAAFREKQLLLAGLQGFRQAVAEARQWRRLELLQAEMFDSWRRLAANSTRHWRYEAAREHRQRHLLRAAVASWRASTEATAVQLAQFWLRWQVQVPLRHCLALWRAMAAVRRREAQQQALALAFRRLSLQRRSLMAWRLAAVGRHEHHVAGRVVEGQQRGLAADSSRSALTTAIIISRRRHHAPSASPTKQQQEQMPPVAGLPASAATTSCSSGSAGCAAAAAAQGMLDAVSSWRAAADYWRQRQQTYGGLQQPAPAAVHASAVGAHTAAKLAELRAQWPQ